MSDQHQRDTTLHWRRLDSAEYDFCSGEIVTPDRVKQKRQPPGSDAQKNPEGLTLAAWLRLERFGLLHET